MKDKVKINFTYGNNIYNQEAEVSDKIDLSVDEIKIKYTKEVLSNIKLKFLKGINGKDKIV